MVYYPYSSKILQIPCESVFGPPKGQTSGGVCGSKHRSSQGMTGRLGYNPHITG